MSIIAQKRLAWAGVAVGLAIFAGANLHLVRVAFQSQPDCAIMPNGPAPAKSAC